MEDFHDARTAEASLAAAHTGTGSSLHTIKRPCTERTMNRIEDLTFGDRLTAADDLTVRRILLNEFISRGR